jgi:hypothetical protein
MENRFVERSWGACAKSIAPLCCQKLATPTKAVKAAREAAGANRFPQLLFAYGKRDSGK